MMLFAGSVPDTDLTPHGTTPGAALARGDVFDALIGALGGVNVASAVAVAGIAVEHPDRKRSTPAMTIASTEPTGARVLAPLFMVTSTGSRTGRSPPTLRAGGSVT